MIYSYVRKIYGSKMCFGFFCVELFRHHLEEVAVSLCGPCVLALTPAHLATCDDVASDVRVGF